LCKDFFLPVTVNFASFTAERRDSTAAAAATVIVGGVRPPASGLGGDDDDDAADADVDGANTTGLVSARLRADVRRLTASLDASAARTHWVLCVRPNRSGARDLFEPAAVLPQLRALRVLPAAKMARDGFAYRALYVEFFEYFALLAASGKTSGSIAGFSAPQQREACEKLLVRLLSDPYLAPAARACADAGGVAYVCCSHRLPSKRHHLGSR